MAIQTTNPTLDISDRSTRQLGQVSSSDFTANEYLEYLYNEIKRISTLVEEIKDHLPSYPAIQSTTPNISTKGAVWIDNTLPAPWETKVYDTTGLTPYATQVLADSPIAYWKLNDVVGTTTAVDSSGNGHTLTLSSGTVTYGTAGGPVGTDTYPLFNIGALTASGTTWLPSGVQPYTMEA